MHTFWVKLCNLTLIGILIFGYNTVLAHREEQETAHRLAYEQAHREKTVGAQTEKSQRYTDGVYTGEAEGYGGPVIVEAAIENGTLTRLTVVSSEHEDAAYFDAASILLDEIVEQQSTDVDTVSGATFSSNGIIHAAQKALKKAEEVS